MSITSPPPPLYSPSQPAPSYCSSLLPDELRLEHNPRPYTRPTPTGAFIKKAPNATLVLSEQEDAATIPVYGRNSVISGEIHLDNRQDVHSVAMKLGGIQRLQIVDGGSRKRTMFADKYTLWKRIRQTDLCPAVVPFSCILPSTYTERDRKFTLPPSYEVAYPTIPGLFASCLYTFSVVITKHRKLALSQRNIVEVPLNYYPRSRPNRPIVPPQYTFFTAVKTSPEEWCQVLSTMSSRPNSDIQPISCHLFIPSVKVYSLSDSIPFHLQLTAPIKSLHAFLPPEPPQAAPLTSDSLCSRNIIPNSKPVIRVFLLRQICIEVHGRKECRNCVLGEGKLKALPPSANSPVYSKQLPTDTIASLDWEGEVRCNDSCVTGSFNAGKLVVQDFISLSLTPPHPQSSPLLEHRNRHFIKLVTDPWIDAIPASMRS